MIGYHAVAPASFNPDHRSKGCGVISCDRLHGSRRGGALCDERATSCLPTVSEEPCLTDMEVGYDQ
jgi:hypothetical protein